MSTKESSSIWHWASWISSARLLQAGALARLMESCQACDGSNSDSHELLAGMTGYLDKFPQLASNFGLPLPWT